MPWAKVLMKGINAAYPTKTFNFCVMSHFKLRNKLNYSMGQGVDEGY